MFQVRDYSLFMPSPNADRAFKRLHRFDLLVKVLFAALIAVCLWNIGVLIQLRLIPNQDLADVRSISSDLSTRLVWILTLMTLGAIVLREWTSGGATAITMLIPLSILLGLVLVPAAMSEIQPPLQDQTLRVVMNDCPPKAIVNGRLSSMGRCTPHAIADVDVLLAVSDPAGESFRTIPPASGGQNTIAFTMQGRGTYTVYFMFRSDDMQACEHQIVMHRNGELPEDRQACVEYDGAAWLVMPHTTSSNLPSGIHLIEVAVP